MTVYILLLAILWWTFAVIVFTRLEAQNSLENVRDRAMCIGLAVFWPIVAVCVFPVLVYQSFVASAAQIRSDLKNRGVLREFEQWLEDRNGKILPKD